MEQTCLKAREASLKLALWSDDQKNALLKAISENVSANTAKIAAANQKDLDEAEKMLAGGELSGPLVKRLSLQGPKIAQLNSYLESVASLPNPVGVKQFGMRLDNGMDLERVSCPLGVLAVIFESRPEVVVQVSALSIKSSNAVILKGGKEAKNSNRALWEIINETLVAFDLEGAVGLMESREDVDSILSQDKYVDLIIPRGGNAFVQYIQNNTKIPVLGHADGICHVYLDSEADKDMAIKLTLDSKLDYPSACNAVETLLVHESVAKGILPDLAAAFKKEGVELRGCESTTKIVAGLKEATADDWATEYTDLILSIKIVKTFEEAVTHINQYGSGHTDSIITENEETAETFMGSVDSGCVFHNASTRFSDGFVFGLGAEVGISTNKTHARGPVGLEGLVIYKYKLRASGQIKGDYSSGKKTFLHERLA
ncbi:MAG: glutamate-5-semialdehyde dehydrogenase [SAR324 cluster bacterium]|nr:glutamate-5-semialdehyde dehydrogenase [SAR324 cluster bacterium]